jgi:hypothetical protein
VTNKNENNNDDNEVKSCTHHSDDSNKNDATTTATYDAKTTFANVSPFVFDDTSTNGSSKSRSRMNHGCYGSGGTQQQETFL